MKSTLAKRIAIVGQREVARRSGVHQPHISAWINGKRNLTDKKLQAIAKACGYRIEITVLLMNEEGTWLIDQERR